MISKRKFNFLWLGGLPFGAALFLLLASGMVRAQAPASGKRVPKVSWAERPPLFLGTKTPYVEPEGGYTPVPAGFQPVFVNYAGRHGARFMTKAGADIESLKLLEAASEVHGLTGMGMEIKVMVERLCALEKGQYENITLLGADEQKAIGARLLSRYGAAFSGRGLEVVTTYKARTQQSADAFLQAFPGYSGPRHFSKLPDTLDAVLRFYDLSPGYQRYKKSAVLKAALDSLEKDHRTLAIAAAVSERVFTTAFRSGLNAGDELRFMDNLYDLYSVGFSLTGELKARGLVRDSVDVGIVFSREGLQWVDLVSGVQDFLEKGPDKDPLGIQVRVAAPLLADFVRTTDVAVGSSPGAGKKGNGPDAVLRFTHAEAISPFASLLGIPEASVPESNVYHYPTYWQAERIIPLSANIQWIIYGNGGEYLVKVLLNEREVRLPIGKGKGPYYSWKELRAYCIRRLQAVGAGLAGDQLDYLKGLR